MTQRPFPWGAMLTGLGMGQIGGGLISDPSSVRLWLALAYVVAGFVRGLWERDRLVQQTITDCEAIFKRVVS